GDPRQRIDLLHEGACYPIEDAAEFRRTGVVDAVARHAEGVVRPAQVLDGELHRRQRVFDFVSDLPGHLAPGELALLLGEYPPALRELLLHRVEGLDQLADLVACRYGDRPFELSLGDGFETGAE